jgi:hypothetical protein
MTIEAVSTAPIIGTGSNAPPAPTAEPDIGTNVPKTPEATPADTAVDPKTVAHIARLSKEAREARQKNAALEAAIKEAEAKAASTPAELKAKAERLDRLEAAKAAGKHLDVLKELGVEFEAIIQAQLDKDPDAQASPEALKALEEIEKLKAKDAEREEKAKKEQAEKEAAALKAGADRARAWIGDKVKSDLTRWELCARADGAEGRENAVELAFEATAKKANAIAAEKKAAGEADDWRPNKEEAEALVVEALDLIEAHLDAKGKLYTRQGAQNVQRSSKHEGLQLTSTDIDAKASPPTLGNDRGPTRTLTRPRTQMTAREARERYRASLRE